MVQDVEPQLVNPGSLIAFPEMGELQDTFEIPKNAEITSSTIQPHRCLDLTSEEN